MLPIIKSAIRLERHKRERPLCAAADNGLRSCERSIRGQGTIRPEPKEWLCGLEHQPYRIKICNLRHPHALAFLLNMQAYPRLAVGCAAKERCICFRVGVEGAFSVLF